MRIIAGRPIAEPLEYFGEDIRHNREYFLSRSRIAEWVLGFAVVAFLVWWKCL